MGIDSIGMQNWSKLIFDIGDYIGMDGEYILPELINGECVRVKYLDREDIESLGFVCTGDTGDEEKEFQLYGSSGEKGILRSDSYESWILLEMSFDNEVTITKEVDKNGDGLTSDFILFKGTIKNKSELKTLLKQLGI